MRIITRYQSLLALIFLLGIAHSYPTCEQIDVEGYLFQLSKLPSNNVFNVRGNVTGFAQFSFCKPDQSCTLKKTFIKFEPKEICYLFSSQTNPMKENYTLIDRMSPKKGLKINYLPYRDVTNTTQTQRTASLSIYCPAAFTSQTYCTLTKHSDTKQVIDCHFPSDAGCATLKLNYFWQFLSDNSIIFAILLWIMALFELLFGYLAIRMTIFVFGVLSGSIFGIIYTAENYVDFIYEDQGYGIAVFVICLSVLMGILFGVTLLTLPRIGYMNIGLWVAVIFSLLMQNSVLYLTGDLLAFYITVGVVGLLMSIIALLKLKNYIILSTSFVSAFWMVRPLGFFLSSYPNQFLSGQTYLLKDSTEWQFYLYLISIVILTILGSVFQFCCFKKSASGNQAYYLEEQGSLRQKFKKLLQFEEVRNFVRSGADQLRFFKKLIIDQDSGKQENSRAKSNYISKNQDDQEQSVEEQKPVGRKKTRVEKQMDDYQAKKSKKQQKKAKIVISEKQNQRGQNNKKNRKIVEVQPIQLSSEGQHNNSIDEESDDIKPNKLVVNNKKNKR